MSAFGDFMRRSRAERETEAVARLGALVYTPGDIRSLMEVVEGEAAKLDREVASSTVSAGWKAGWGAFLAEWRVFYKAHEGLWGRLWGSSYEQTETFRLRLERWRTDFVAQGGHSVGPGTTVDEGINWKRVAIFGGITVVVAALLGAGRR